ncbi:MAG: hypothetical protein MK108_01335 [Mariniblastus sp.]|nr:hypothetical protein [Mariniblastus sp.]
MTSIVFDRRSRWHSVWPALIIVVLWLVLFWPFITGEYVAGFRDSVYLYYPLFKFIDMEWASGGIPLYNLYDGGGQPLLADGSSSIFYPGKLVFFFRFLSFPTRYGWYLSLHVLLAAATAYHLARTLRCNRLGGTTAAISYAFGGSVLFQVNNVIYLVGAAWLPLALTCIWMMFCRPGWKWPLAGGAVCALMLLGGDPQMVYNVGLIAAATLVVTSFAQVRRFGRRGEAGQPLAWIGAKTVRLLLLVVVTSVLSAIQLLPSYEIVNSSRRAQPRDGPVNLYGFLAQSPVQTSVAEALLGNPPPGSHQSHIYQFSMPPWTLAELLWPNVSGQPFPVNRRWVGGLPGADRVWVPSIYMGVLTLLLAFCSFRLWGRSARDIWLSRVGLWFALASFGWYGLAWLLGELGFVFTFGEAGQVSGDAGAWQVGPQVGGLYWLMVVALPKYFWFRYPAKLFLIAVLAISILAGRTLSRPLPLQRMMQLAAGVILLSLIGCFLASWVPRWIEPFRDPVFGPLQMESLSGVVLFSVCQTMLVLVGGLLVLVRIAMGRGRRLIWGALFLGILIGDLVIANRWMLAGVPATAFETPVEPKYQTWVPWDQAVDSLKFKARPLSPNPYQGSGFAVKSSENRLAENVIWQRETLFPKHHLPLRIVHPNSFASIESSGPSRGVLKRIEEYRQQLGDSVILKVKSGSFDLRFEIPPDFVTGSGRTIDRASELIPLAPESGDWKIQLINQEDGRPIETFGSGKATSIEGRQFYEIPSGSWRIVGRYWPLSFVRGAQISLVGWCIWLALMVSLSVRRRRSD